MKYLVLILTLLFSPVLFAPISYAGWTKVNKSISGDTSYVDYDRVRKQSGYIYFWQLQDYLHSTKYAIRSKKTYNQVDCKLLRYKSLSSVVYKKPMGLGWWRTLPKGKSKWQFPSSGSVIKMILIKICSK